MINTTTTSTTTATTTTAAAATTTATTNDNKYNYIIITQKLHDSLEIPKLRPALYVKMQ
jgi:hypothetical protein